MSENKVKKLKQNLEKVIKSVLHFSHIWILSGQNSR